MSIVKVTNTSGSKLFLRDMYTDLLPGQTKTIIRTPAELSDMVGLQQFICDGLVSVDIQLQPKEEPSELVSIWPLGMNWRGVVANFAALPLVKNRVGDIRLTLNTFELWRWDGATWSLVGTGPSGAAGGDLGGSYPNPTVTGIEGIPVEPAPPANGDALLYNSALNQWQHAPIVFGGGPPVGPAGGDLGGIYPNPQVVGIYNTPVSNTAPALDEVLQYDGANWTPTALPSSLPPSGPAGGDLDGNYPNPTVDGLQGNPVDPVAPIANQVLTWSGVRWTPTFTGGGSGSAAYGAFSDSTDQNLVANVPLAVQLNTVETAGGVTIANDPLTLRPTRITVPISGVYSLEISPQMLHTGGTTVIVYFWGRIDGTDVPRSATSFEMGNNNNRACPFIQIELYLNAGQYFEWVFMSSGNNTSLEHFPLVVGPPAIPEIPSVIVNVKWLAP